MTQHRAFWLLLLGSLFTACAGVRQSSDITALDRVYRVRANQRLYILNARGQIRPVSLLRPADAALFQREDTLYAEFAPATLPPADKDPLTLDQSDSLAFTFYHYNAKLDRLAEKSPWFYYQLTTFDVDLFTIPFKYRFAQPGRAGELATSANIGLYTGIRYDLGRYRNVYYRRERRSEVESFSFGVGSVFSFDPVTVNEFNTDGRFTGEYDALGFSYGAATIVGYKSITAGLTVSFQNLADRNNRLWVYRQKPWLGITIGINLN